MIPFISYPFLVLTLVLPFFQDTELHKASYKGDLARVEELLEDGENVDARGAQNVSLGINGLLTSPSCL